MADLLKAGGLTLGLVVVGAIVVGIGLGGCQPLSQSVKEEGTVSPPAPKTASGAAIPALDTEAAGDMATATFALG